MRPKTFNCEKCGKPFEKMSDKTDTLCKCKSSKRKDDLSTHISMVNDKVKMLCQHCGTKISKKKKTSVDM